MAAGLVALLLIGGGCAAAYVLLSAEGGLAALSGAPQPEPTAAVSRAPTLAPRETGNPTEQALDPTAAAASPTPAVDPTATATLENAPVPAEEPTLEPTAEPVTGTQAETEEPSADNPTEQPAPHTPTSSSDAGTGDPSGLPSPSAVVDEFIRVTLGTVPGASVDYDRARVLMTVAYAGEFVSPEFVPQTYGIQEGPTGYQLTGEEIAGKAATVMVNGYWGENLGREWRFDLLEEAGIWRVADIQVVGPGQPEEEESPFWQLNPRVEEFIVYDHGGWKLVLEFDPPAEDIRADFRMEYRRVDDGTLAYDHAVSGTIQAGRVRLILDTDWTGYDLYALGFRPGRHRLVASMDGVEIAVGEFVVE